jgi:hypothetical protein
MELHGSFPRARLVKNKVSLCETQYAEAGSVVDVAHRAEPAFDVGDTMKKPPFAEIWSRLVAYADRPFLTDGGHEFSYQVEGEALRLSHRDALLPTALLERAWERMPCAAAELPGECKPKGYVWALLHDTRIAGVGLLPEIPAALAQAAKQQEKSVAELRPKPRKRRSNRAAARARKRAEAHRSARG